MSTEKLKILIVDDNPANLFSLEKLLQRQDLEIITAASGNEALALVLEHDFALVLLDVQMPEMDGFETASYLGDNADTKHIPIIFVTAIDKDQQNIFRGYQSGAVDYIFKPFEPEIILSKVNVFLELHRQKMVLKGLNKELKNKNDIIKQQQEALVNEERLKVLLETIGAICHELSQPLQAISGYAELLGILLRKEKVSPDVKEKLSRILGQIERVNDIHRKIMRTTRYKTKKYGKIGTIIDVGE